METKKDQWIREQMESLKGVKRATPSPFLMTGIFQKIQSTDHQRDISSPSSAWWAVAALFFLLLLNIFMINQLEQQNTSADTEGELHTVMEEYDLFITSNLEEQ